MKYKVGDKVRIKSKEWWDAQPKNVAGSVDCGNETFTKVMTSKCGMVCEISKVSRDGYAIKEFGFNWTDEMFEGLVSDEKPTISADLIKDIAEVIKTHNLGVSVSEKDGKLIVEPLNVEEDLPIDTPCMVSSNKYDWFLRYYAGKKHYYANGSKSCDHGYVMWGEYIIPFDKFNPNDIEESLKYNIVKQ